MNLPSFDEFRQKALAAGFDEVLARDVPHDERYGPEGAAYWVARKS